MQRGEGEGTLEEFWPEGGKGGEGLENTKQCRWDVAAAMGVSKRRELLLSAMGSPGVFLGLWGAFRSLTPASSLLLFASFICSLLQQDLLPLGHHDAMVCALQRDQAHTQQ